MKQRLYNTRFASLQYTCEAPSQWTIVDAESTKDNGFTVPIGPKYASKDELLADLERFATERGYNTQAPNSHVHPIFKNILNNTL
jgi:hypothetical protein